MSSSSLLVERFAALASAMPVGVLELDADGACLFANPKAAQQTGRGPEALEGNAWLDAVHLSDRLEVEAMLDMHEPFDGRVRLVTPSGRETPTRLHLAPLDEGEGWVVTLEQPSAPAAEVHGRRRIEEALERTREQMRQMVDNNPAVVFVKDLDLRYMLVNREFERVFGRTESDMLGRRDEQGAEHDRAVLLNQRPLEVEQVVLVGGEPRNYLSHKFPLRDPSGAVYAVATASVDITDREEVARELERSNRDLEQFASVASHDLAAPLRTISGFAHLLKARHAGGLDEEGLRCLDRISQGTARMERLLSDVLAYARVGSEERLSEPVALHDVVVEVLEGLEASIQEKDALVTVEPLPRVSGDPRLLRQLFANLLGNALKFTGERRPRVQVLAERDGASWILRVRDNGIGMHARDREQIFKMFGRLHGRDAFEGTGIGLALCKRIAELHGGTIEVDSTPGGGSTFTFALPAA